MRNEMEHLTKDHAEEWKRVFSTYAVGKSTPVDAARMAAYWEQLAPLPFSAVAQAADELKQEPGPFMVDPATWRTRALRVAAKLREKAAIEMEHVLMAPNEDTHTALAGPTVCCRLCSDSGWFKVPLTQKERRFYGASGGQGTVRRCDCWETNPVLLRSRAFHESRRAEKAARVGK